jgi:hypothetical protein
MKQAAQFARTAGVLRSAPFLLDDHRTAPPWFNRLLLHVPLRPGLVLAGLVLAGLVLAGLWHPGDARAQARSAQEASSPDEGTSSAATGEPSRVTVAVLGVRSLEGDDDFARDLSAALRAAASRVEGWDVSEREVTLDQMMLAHGCDEPLPECLEQIATSLRVDRVIFGEVRRTGTGSAFDWSVSLRTFDARGGQPERSLTEVVPGSRRDIDALREPARRFATMLSGARQLGTLRVAVNVPGAEVFIDGESVGVVDDQGRLSVPNVQAGNRSIRVSADGHQGFRGSISVVAFGETVLETELEARTAAAAARGEEEPATPSEGGGWSPELVAGIALTATGVALAAGWIGSWARLDLGLQRDAGFLEYRENAGSYLRDTQGMDVDINQIDVCSLNAQNRYLNDGSVQYTEFATGDRARAVCDEASTLEALQFVFGIGAAAATGVGVYFLVSALTGTPAQPATQAFRLVPSVGPNHAYLGAHLSF